MAVVGSWSTLIMTESTEVGQEPLEIVHVKVVEAPAISPVTPDAGKAGEVIVAVPETTVHNPVPTAGVLPASVVVVILHRFWSGPALAVVGSWSTVMMTESTEPGHEPLDNVHVKVADAPTISPVTPDAGEAGVVIVAVPEMTAQIPVPTTGVLPASVVVVTLHRFWSEPALAVVGSWSTFILTVSTEFGHEPLEIVHVKVADAPVISPVTPDVGKAGVVIVAVPETTAQIPVPTAGVFPASVVVVISHKFWSGPALAVVGN